MHLGRLNSTSSYDFFFLALVSSVSQRLPSTWFLEENIFLFPESFGRTQIGR